MSQVPFTTYFRTFSRYSPLIFEGKLDSKLLGEYINTHVSSTGPSSKRTKIDTTPTSTASVSTKVDAAPTEVDSAPTEVDAAPVLASPPVMISPNTQTHTLIRPARSPASPSAAESIQSIRVAPTVDTHPRTHTAWQSIIKNAADVTLGDVRLEKPHLADGNDVGEPTAAPPATGFMLEGTIKLFGLESHSVSLQSWHGSTPPDVDSSAVDVPVYQRVQLGSIRPAELVPALANTPLATFDFRNVTITYQNCRL